MKQQSKNSLFKKIIIMFMALAITFSYLSYVFAGTISFNVFGATTSTVDTFVDYSPTALSISNTDFSESSGYLTDPTSWTASVYDGKSDGSTVKGVLDLEEFASSSDSRDDSKLNEYSEWVSSTPKLPTSVWGTEDTSNSFLLINTTPSTQTVTGYESADVTLSSSSYYRFSVWVKTSSFAKHGAAVRLSGIDYESAADYKVKGFSNIDTSSTNQVGTASNNYGWVEYTMFVKTSQLTDITTKLVLSVGDYYSGEDIYGDSIAVNENASGYAFFDNVQAQQISPTTYNASLSSIGAEGSENTQFIDLSVAATTPTSDGSEVALSFENSSDWQSVMAEGQGNDWSSIVGPTFYNTAEIAFDSDNNKYGLDTRPIPADGMYGDDIEGYDESIIILSTYDETRDKFDASSVAVGYRSDYFDIEMFKFYRLSVWVQTQDISSTGSGASVVVTTDAYSYSLDEEYSFSATGCTGDSSNEARYGWKEYSFYIAGSQYKEYSINLGLWLGQEDAQSSGIAMFSNIEFNEITSTQYNSYSGSGSAIVSIDGYYTDVNVTNGSFSTYDEQTYEPTFPAPVYGWTYNTPSTITSSGYSMDESFIETDEIISGIMITEENHYNTYKEYYGTGAIRPTDTESQNVLYMASTELTAFNYTSSAISVDASSVGALTVRMRVDNVTGYGASLVLKNGSQVITSIENITSTNFQFKDYTFYVEGDTSSNDITLEIWMGCNEYGTYNANKLSTGNIYVDCVEYESISTSYSTILAQYKTDLSNINFELGPQLNYSTYSFKEMYFTEYDIYSDDYVKRPYLISAVGTEELHYGIFDTSNIPSIQSEIPSTFSNPDTYDDDLNLYNNNVIYQKTTKAAYSKMTLDRSYSLSSGGYYRISVNILVDVKKSTDTAIGAGIAISGTDYEFEDIDFANNDNILDQTEFRTYYFYIYAGDSAQTVSLEFTLGGEYEPEYVTGSMYINDITFEEISSSTYTSKTTNLHISTDNIYTVSYADASSDTAASTDDLILPTIEDFNWLLIPSIIFSVALIILIIGIVARKMAESRVRRRPIAGTIGRFNEYDRRFNEDEDTIDKADEIFEDATEISLSSYNERKLYEEFDDESVAGQAKIELTNKQKQKAERNAILDKIRAQQAADEYYAKMKDEDAAAATNVTDTEVVEEQAISQEVQTQEEPTTTVRKKNDFYDGFDD